MRLGEDPSQVLRSETWGTQIFQLTCSEIWVGRRSANYSVGVYDGGAIIGGSLR